MLAFKLVAEAAKGDMRAMNAVLDRVEGKVRQNVGLSRSDYCAAYGNHQYQGQYGAVWLG
jgi:hypothetical protein